MRRFAALVAGLLLTFVLVPPAQATPTSYTECSAALFDNDAALGPETLPKLGPVGVQLLGYERTGSRSITPTQFLNQFQVNGRWTYPPADGFVTNQNGTPRKRQQVLPEGELIDRYGSEYGRFLAPAGLRYAKRSIPPQSLVGTPAAGCNYHRYEVVEPFTVWAGEIAPWFNQRGGGQQYMLAGALVPNAPADMNVQWLLANDYLVVSPST